MLRKQQVSINNPKHPTRVQSSLAHQWNLDGPQARLASADPKAPNKCPKQPCHPSETGPPGEGFWEAPDTTSLQTGTGSSLGLQARPQAVGSKIAPPHQQKHCYRPGKLKEGAGELSTSETQRQPPEQKKSQSHHSKRKGTSTRKKTPPGMEPRILGL